MNEVLIYGIGNPSRQDDALGILFVEKFEKLAGELSLKGFKFETNYQLNIEDTAVIKDYKFVFLVDASHENIEEVFLTEIIPDYNTSISSHHVTPATLLKLCKDIFNTAPVLMLLQIKGYEWELDKPITTRANENLEKAVEYAYNIIMSFTM